MTTDPARCRFPRASLHVVGLAWLIPFLQPYHRYPITAFYSEWLALALGLGAALLLLRAESWRAAEIPAVVLAPLGLVLVLGLQVALGRVIYPEQALVAALYLLWAALLVILGRVLRRELGLAAVVAVLAWWVLAGGLLSAVAGLLQLYDAAGPLAFLVADRESPAVYGNLSQRNHFAAYTALGIAAAGYLYSRGHLSGPGVAPCLLLFALVLAVSGSRSPWLYLALFAVLAAACYALQRDVHSRRLVVYAVSLLSFFALAQWVASLPLLQPAGGLVTSAERLFESASGIAPRLQLAREAWEMFLGAPGIGAGWGQFAWQHFLYLGAHGPGAMPHISNHAHNIVLHLLAETGVAGAALVAGAAAIWLAGLRQVRLDPEWWWLLALVGVLGIHSLLELPLWYAYFLGITALVAGLGSHHVIATRRTGVARAIAALFILSGVIHLAAAAGTYREFERLVSSIERRTATGMSGAEFESTIARLRQDPVVAPFLEIVVAIGMEVTRERVREKLDLNTRAMRFRPAYNVTLQQAMLLALAGEGAAAARQLDLVLRAFPGRLDYIERQLGELAARYPAEATPLLKLTAARRVKLRGSGAPEGDTRRR